MKDELNLARGMGYEVRGSVADVRDVSSLEAIEAIQQSRASTLVLRPEKGADVGAILSLVPQVHRLFARATLTDYSIISAFTQVEELGLEGNVPLSEIDFSKLVNLRRLTINSDASVVQGVLQCPSLVSLELIDANVQDLQPLRALGQLEELWLRETSLRSLRGIEFLSKLRLLDVRAAPLESLHGIEQAKRLESVEFVDLHRIDSISPLLSAPRLRRLAIHGAKRVADLEQLARLSELEGLDISGLKIDWRWLSAMTSLQTLRIEKCGALDDLSFLVPLQRLRKLFLFETRVLSGDMSLLLAMPNLRDVRFKKYRGYSHSIDDILPVLDERHGTIRPSPEYPLY